MLALSHPSSFFVSSACVRRNTNVPLRWNLQFILVSFHLKNSPERLSALQSCFYLAFTCGTLLLCISLNLTLIINFTLEWMVLIFFSSLARQNPDSLLFLFVLHFLSNGFSHNSCHSMASNSEELCCSNRIPKQKDEGKQTYLLLLLWLYMLLIMQNQYSIVSRLGHFSVLGRFDGVIDRTLISIPYFI